MSTPEAPSPDRSPDPESADRRFTRAALEWGRLLEGGVVVGSTWQDRLGGRVVVHCLSLAGPTLSGVVTVRSELLGPRGPLLSYPLSEFCAYEQQAGQSWAYRFTRVLTGQEKKGS